MRKRQIAYALWVLLAGCLYFFENNTDTLILLLSSLLLPLLPEIRPALFLPDEVKSTCQQAVQTRLTLTEREESDPGSVRLWESGDPVNRIHWKLSAKRDTLLVREWEKAPKAEEAQSIRTETLSAPPSKKRPFLPAALLLSAAALILLFVLPGARAGALALANRVFRASEAVNAYRYVYFPVPENTDVVPAVLLLAVPAAVYLILMLYSGSRIMSFSAAAGCILFQIYFGLPFPAWANLLLFLLFLLLFMSRPLHKKALYLTAACILLISFSVMLLLPGPNAAVESASEKARDSLNRIVREIAGTSPELPEGMNETRHVHTQSLVSGNQEAPADREFRLIVAEEEQISLPHWVNYLKIALLLLLTVLVIILPFLPFMLINRKRKKALDEQSAFQSMEVSAAVCAVFRRIISWLEAMGFGGGNLPYRQWTEHLLSQGLPEAYAADFRKCEALFEEAAYSTHAMREEDRRQVLDLLEKTEETMKNRADKKQRFRLRYREWLWL